MESSERDDTQDWLLPADAAPPLIAELEQRIDAAMIVAKASEKAVMAVGDSALEAAGQARRAADLAERAVAAAQRASEAPQAEGSVQSVSGPSHLAGASAGAPLADPALRSFSERADRVVARLRVVCAPALSSGTDRRGGSRSAGPRRGSPGDR